MHPFHLQSKWLLRDLNFKQSLLHDDKYPQSEYQMTHHKQQIDVIKKLQSILGTEKWNSTRILMYKKLSQIKELEWFKQQIVRPRQKRSVIYFSDPFFDQQWHLVNYMDSRLDINVSGVWARGITGRGVTAVVLDDGLEWLNNDLRKNYNPAGSWDYIDDDDDPMPDKDGKPSTHGTRCAGEIAAAANGYCGVGVAYEANIAGVRILDGPITDSVEAAALMRSLEVNDVFSCSWGPDDDGKTIDGPHYLTKRALQFGTNYGRNGYGAVYVVAGGNGGSYEDNCNYDGYTSSVYTIAVGAVDDTGRMPPYGEPCASLLAVALSNGLSAYSGIVTTDLSYLGGCTRSHSGTSAAAPIAAGIVALMLQARPCLYWRDVQHLIVMTSRQINTDRDALWYKNAAGFSHSHKHGFGLLDAWRLVTAAEAWISVPWMTDFTSDLLYVEQLILEGRRLNVSHYISQYDLIGFNLNSLEYVHVTVWLQHECRGDIEIVLFCPSGTHSVLATPRPRDKSKDGLDGWTFGTVRCWGENPIGLWTLSVTDTSSNKDITIRGQLDMWQLTLFGSALTQADIQQRQRQVADALAGNFVPLNESAECRPTAIFQPSSEVFIFTERQLLSLAMIGGLVLFIALYELLEYMLFFDDEKRQYRSFN